MPGDTQNLARLRASYRKLKRVVHVLRGHDLWQGAQMECKKVCLGNDGARWCVCPEELRGSSVVYSFGIGEDISFDLELIQRFGVRIHAFDPTPRSIEWLESQRLREEFVFHAFGVADFDGSCRFAPPQNPAHVSHTLVAQHTSRRAIELPVQRLGTIMRTLGHEQVDLLKMDVEGAEYGVLADLLACRIRVGQLLVEFHHRWPEIGVGETRQAIRALNGAGYRIFSVSAGGDEYSFRRI